MMFSSTLRYISSLGIFPIFNNFSILVYNIEKQLLDEATLYVVPMVPIIESATAIRIFVKYVEAIDNTIHGSGIDREQETRAPSEATTTGEGTTG